MKFWNKYLQMDELEQRKVLKQLIGTEEDKNGFFKYMTLTLFKSYIDDTLKNKENKK